MRLRTELVLLGALQAGFKSEADGSRVSWRGVDGAEDSAEAGVMSKVLWGMGLSTGGESLMTKVKREEIGYGTEHSEAGQSCTAESVMRVADYVHGGMYVIKEATIDGMDMIWVGLSDTTNGLSVCFLACDTSCRLDVAQELECRASTLYTACIPPRLSRPQSP